VNGTTDEKAHNVTCMSKSSSFALVVL